MHAPDATVYVAALAAAGAVASAWISHRTRKDQQTGNGHTIGRAISRIEEQQANHENRLDRIEVRITEDGADIKERLMHAVFDKERHMTLYRHDRRWDDE